MKTLLSIATFITCLWSYAQPNTEVYLFDIEPHVKYGLRLSNPVNISDNEGYDNQPSFWPDGQSLIYARTVDGQTEIARYFIDTGKTEIITNTLQGSEYSPTPMPDGRISSIRLDTTGLQLLYAYDLNGKEEVLVEESVIGYHAWINETDIVAFVLGEPMTMQIIDTQTDENLVVEDSIGRSLHKIPNTERFSYVDKSSEKWAIKSMNPKTGQTDLLIDTKENAEDYCWTPDGRIVMGQDNVLWMWNGRDKWFKCSDLGDFGLTGSISRVTISPDGKQMAVVVSQ